MKNNYSHIIQTKNRSILIRKGSIADKFINSMPPALCVAGMVFFVGIMNSLELGII